MDKLARKLGPEPAVINKPNEFAKEYADKATQNLIKRKQRDLKCLDYFARNQTMSFNIEPMARERERLDKPMTVAERALRKQWVIDQKLSPNEPRHVPELHGERRGFVRSLWHGPFDLVDKLLEPVVGRFYSSRINRQLRNFMIPTMFLWFSFWYVQYRPMKWYSGDGVFYLAGRRPCYPGDPDYGALPKKDLDDFFDHGFKNRKVLLPKE